MRKRHPALKLSLLSCAVAVAAGSLAQDALAVDLCSGKTSVSINKNVAGDTCTVDTAAAKVTVGTAGRMDRRINVSVADATVTNNGVIAESAQGSSSVAAYGINATTLSGGKLSNAGTISATANSTGTGTSADASAYGVRFGALSGASVTNSGRITVQASAEQGDWAGAYGLGSWSGGWMDGSTIRNTADGRITASAAGDRASAYGIFYNGTMVDGAAVINSGTITATATGQDGSHVSAYGIYLPGAHYDSSISNAGTITATATATGTEWAGARGINAGYLYGSSTVGNSGTLKATAASAGASASAYGIRTIRLHDSAVVRNSGQITASASSGDDSAYAYGIYTGSLNDASAVINSGSIKATASADTWASAYGIRVSNAYDNASVTNSGTIVASATSLNSQASANGINLRGINGAVTLTNAGRITAQVVAEDWAGAYGMGSWWGGTLNQGSMTNTRTGVITAEATASDTYYATAYGMHFDGDMIGSVLSNQGTITAKATGLLEAYASAYGMYFSGSASDTNITNSGTIKATALTTSSEWAGAWGIYASSISGASGVSNSGTIIATARGGSNAEAYGIQVGDMSGSSTVSNSGVITATADGQSWVSGHGIRVLNLNGTASVLNSGTIVARAGSQTSSASAYGIRFNALGSDASVTNTGRITTTVAASEWAGAYAMGSWEYWGSKHGTLENRGSLLAQASGSRASAYGLFMQAHNLSGATLVNSGTVQVTTIGNDGSYASAYGIYAYGAASRADVAISNSGSIVATATGHGSSQWVGAYGIRSAGTTGVDNTVSNSGMITATARSSNDSASAYGIEAGWLSGTSTVTNSGRITARAEAPNGSAWGYGIYAAGLNDTASITNSGTILVSASGSDSSDVTAYGIVANNTAAGASITNSGTIMARAAGDGEAWSIDASGSGQVVNSGLMVGSLYLGNTMSMTNSGTLVTDGNTASYIGGDYTQQAGGVLGLSLRDTSRYGSLTVDGTADFTGSNVIRIAIDPRAAISDGDVFTNVLYAGTLTASSDLDVKDLSVFWNFDVVFNANGFDLVAEKVGLGAALGGTGLALTTSQVALIEGALGGGLGSDYAAFIGALNTASTAAAAAAALEQVGPALPGAAGFAARSVSSTVGGLVSARLGETRGASSGDASGSNSVWIKPFFGKAEQDAGQGLSGYDVDSGGFVLGVDGNVGDALRVGVAVAAAQADVGGASASLDVDTTQFTLYGSYALGEAAALDVGLSHAVNRYDSVRNVAFAGSRATADYDGRQTSLGVTLSNRLALGEKHAFVPALQARYQRVSLDGYTEAGAGALNLSVADVREDSLLWAAKAGFEFAAGPGTLLASAGVGYDTLDAASVTATLNGGTGPTFVSNGVKPESTVLTGGLGYRYVTAKNLEINAAYDLESRGDFQAQTASVTFRLPF